MDGFHQTLEKKKVVFIYVLGSPQTGVFLSIPDCDLATDFLLSTALILNDSYSQHTVSLATLVLSKRMQNSVESHSRLNV